MPVDHDLQAVVFGRVVRTGDRDAAGVFAVVRGEIDQRRRHHADIDHRHAGRDQALDQALGDFRRGQAAVAADDDAAQAFFDQHRTDRLTNQTRDPGIEIAADDAADVVGAEDGALERHLRAHRFHDVEHRRHLGLAFIDHALRFHLRQRQGAGGIFGILARPVAPTLEVAGNAQYQEGEYAENHCQPQLAETLGVERALIGQRRRGHDPPGRAGQLAGIEFCGRGQIVVTALDQVDLALAQGQESPPGDTGVERGIQGFDRHLRIHQTHFRPGTDRFGQADLGRAADADHPHGHAFLVDARLQHRELADAESDRIGIGDIQAGWEHLDRFGILHGIAEGQLQALVRHARDRQLVGRQHLFGKCRGFRPERRGHAVARGQDVALGLVLQIDIHALIGEPDGQQGKQPGQCFPRIALDPSLRLCQACFHVHVQRTPVCPNPPLPRALSANCATCTRRARTTGMNTSCAMRSPAWMVCTDWLRFHRLIISGPW